MAEDPKELPTNAGLGIPVRASIGVTDTGSRPKRRIGNNTKQRYKAIPGATMTTPTKKRPKRSPKRGRK
jgi:hypothetical protein